MPGRHALERLSRRRKCFESGRSRPGVASRNDDLRTWQLAKTGNESNARRVGIFTSIFPKDASVDRLAFARWLSRSTLADNRSAWWSIVCGKRSLARAWWKRRRIFVCAVLIRSTPSWIGAVGFMEGTLSSENPARPWSIKQLVRAIVLSSTYRQDSNTTSHQSEIDPLNHYLARGPRFQPKLKSSAISLSARPVF